METPIDSDWRREGIGPRHCRPLTMEAGPSRLPYGAVERVPVDGAGTICRCEACEVLGEKPRDQSRRLRRPSRSTRFATHATSLLPAFLLPFIGTAVAAPAPVPPPTRARRFAKATITSAPDPAHLSIEKRVKYLTSVSTPTALPSVAYVDETVLPYLLTQHDDGHWRRAEGGWSLYGREIQTASSGPIFADSDGDGSIPDDAASTTLPSYAVESALPNGWGVSSNRTSIYKVPLIATASVIMSMVIVAIIIFIVLGRRKKHRRQKRAKERLRRKALAAAGYKEDDLNGSAAEAVFNEKLAELENQHRAKKKKGGQAGLAVGKVKGWNSRMSAVRRRRGKGKGKDEGGAPAVDADGEEDKPVDGVDDDADSLSPVTSLSSQSTGAQQRGTSRGSERGHETSGGTVESAPTDRTLAEVTPLEEGGIVNAEASTGSAQAAPFFPPAYRPASVRSLPRHDGSSSNALAGGSSTSDPTAHVPTHVEKTQAPGYYPAPATEDGEVALAVASRSDGKARVVDPPEEVGVAREERIRHIATDDKRLLEQLRLGASAPPVAGSSSDDGPSAPAVYVDEEGFEQPESGDLSLQAILSHAGPSAAPPPSASAAFPPPPTLTQRFSRVGGLPLATSPSLPIDDSHLLPSAPPALGPEVSAPSAPPLVADGDDDDLYDEASSVPFAPVFELGDEDDPESPSDDTTASTPLPSDDSGHIGSLAERDAPEHDSVRDAVSGDHITRSDSGTGPILFLPQYEP
ncbi:hypothetical protein IAU60_001008 [Kwoniella sp. DSM 27419]